jgi:hypothetical protein
MPKATLTFDLDLPEDFEEFELATSARKYSLVLWELDHYLRNKIKYAAEDAHEEYTNAMAEARDELYRLMGEHNVKLD